MLLYDLQMFAKDGPTGQKTEKPTAKKIKDSRKEGQVAKSQDFSNAVSLLAVFVLMKVWVGHMGLDMLGSFQLAYNKIPDVLDHELTDITVHQWFMECILFLFKVLWPIFLVAVAIVFISSRIQFTFKITKKPMQPKLSKLNPLSGIKRMFSLQTLVKTGVSIAVVFVITVVVYSTIKDKWALLYSVYDMELLQVIHMIGDIVIDLGIKISAVMIVIGIVDFIYQKWKNMQDMMMSKQDIKDEFKNSEGDPQIKSKIKQKQMEASRRRMMDSVPQADVIITNPTHYAVAIRYDRTMQDAPVVIAKGTDYLAGKIKEKARECHIEIVENRALARMLYHNVEIDQEIPPELYQAVAEVLAYVYRLKNSAS